MNTANVALENIKSNRLLWLGWLVCGIGALFYSYEYLLRIAPSVMENEITQHYQIMAGGFGLLSSMYYYAYGPMQIPVGMLLDRYGLKLLLTTACLICVVGTLLFAVTDSVIIAAIGRFLMGFGSAFAFVGVLKLATLWLPEDRLALVAGIAAALGTVGAMVGDNLLTWMVDSIGWQSTLYIMSLVGIAVSFVLWFFIQNNASGERAQTSIDRGTITSFAQSLAELKLIVTNSQIWVNGFYGCLVYLPTSVLAELWGISYLKHAHHLTTQGAGFGNSMMFLGYTIGAPLIGLISDKIHRRILPMFLGALGSGIIVLILFYVPDLSATAVYILMFTLGLFYGCESIVFVVGRELAPVEAAGTAMAFTNMIVTLGSMVLQPLVGTLLVLSLKLRTHIMDLTSLNTSEISRLYTAHDYTFALIVVPLGIFIACVLTYFIKETHAEVG